MELFSIKIRCTFQLVSTYQLTVTFSDCVKTALTGNMDLIDHLNSDIEKEREEATAEAIAFVQEQSL
jgi:hypothetical protein